MNTKNERNSWRLRVFLLTAGIGLLLVYRAIALDLPPVIPEGPDWDTYWNRSTVTTCGCQSIYVYTLDTTACRDFSSEEKEDVKSFWLTEYAGHVAFLGDATYTLQLPWLCIP